MEKLLWRPNDLRIKNSRMFRLMERINRDFGKNITDYDGLHRFSVENTKDFWAVVWDELGVIASAPYAEVVDDPKKLPGAKWFRGAELNFAENLLRHRDDKPALVFLGEDGQRLSLTHNELYDTVARLAKSLKALGVGPGDRVAGFVPNRPETVCAMLAAVSLGAAWSSCSPDFGPKGVLDRFGQIKPKVLFAGDGYFFKGRRFDSLERVREVAESLPTLEKIVVFPTSGAAPDLASVPRAVAWDDFLAQGPVPEMAFAQLPFMHPLYIMYSSGTTGLPKCMVQGAGGILLHHGKEHAFHTDIGPDDVVFYFTTCGWMMWNWLVSVLATGACVVLFDGNPFFPDPGVLWRMAENEKVTVFGTSAGYLTALAATGYVPKDACDLSSVKTLLSTGSPLSEEMFAWVYENVKADLQLSSISGGTDLNGCFALGCPIKPVYAGEIQCLGLGMDVQAWDENGKPMIGTQGELVCGTAFPSMPLYFWNDPEGEKYRAAYFDVYPGVWRHGDFITVTANGGVVMYGRSDATLNPGGVRIGTAEIYRVVDGFSEVADSVVVGQDHQNDVRVILFVKMAEGLTLTDDLKKRLTAAIRTNASPRHVPSKIIGVPDVPYTLNMKKVELAVKNIIENKPVKNRDALANPDALQFYKNLPELAD